MRARSGGSVAAPGSDPPSSSPLRLWAPKGASSAARLEEGSSTRHSLREGLFAHFAKLGATPPFFEDATETRIPRLHGSVMPRPSSRCPGAGCTLVVGVVCERTQFVQL
eukprot:4774364-Prymnesium_polylepis.1